MTIVGVLAGISPMGVAIRSMTGAAVIFVFGLIVAPSVTRAVVEALAETAAADKNQAPEEAAQDELPNRAEQAPDPEPAEVPSPAGAHDSAVV